MSVTNAKPRVYLAVADNFSKIKAYEYAKENDFEIVGQSGYIEQASEEINNSEIDAVICSEKLLDGNSKQLFNKLSEHFAFNKRAFYIVSAINSKTFRIKQISSDELHVKYTDIDEILNYVGISLNLKGYPLFKDALEIALSQPDSLFEMTNKIYKRVAEMHGVSKDSVEYNMRTIRDHSINFGKPEIIYEIFGGQPDGKMPSLGEYLSMLTSYVLRTKY